MGSDLRRLIGALALIAPAPLLAEDAACNIPARLSRPAPEGPTAREPRRFVPIARYTLALAWSPEYCRMRAASARDRVQCGGENAFGFTLHGLWPDGPGKIWPQYCRPAALLPEGVIRRNLCATPSPQLLQHEWAKHGTCMTSDPARYFATASRLYRRVRSPDMAALSRGALTAAGFRRAFARANPGTRPDMIRLGVNARGWLEEVWLCLGTDLAPRRCPATGEGVATGRPIRIWRGRSGAAG
ncbi:MAG: ribonuclease [Sphingomonas bacterium]|nr:ribonuclease [Sphingomonas bacterium]